MGWVCPLTPLENRFRTLSGEAGYAGDLLQHHLLAAIYPEGLTRGVQVALGLAAHPVNPPVYPGLWRRHGGAKVEPPRGPGG